MLAVVCLFYAYPVLNPSVTIKWDAVEYFYRYQKHFSDEILQGRLPAWTSTLFSGFPFLADLQVGAWYPFNWPFFLTGVTPKSMFLEMLLHAALSAWGTYRLLRQLGCGREASAVGGALYPLSGFWTAHAEHISLVQAAAYLPWMLFLFLKVEQTVDRRWLALAIFCGGSLCLTGHFQTVLYIFSAIWMVALLTAIQTRRAVALADAFAISAGSALLSAVQILPSAELVSRSLRATLSAGEWTVGILQARSLMTLIYPNAAGLFQQPYQGPVDISQHYFYTGVLLLPLALVGLGVSRIRALAAILIVPAVWYSLGPSGGLFLLLSKLPGFSSVRAPSHSMLLAVLGLIILAAFGMERVRLRSRMVLPVLATVFALDLAMFNMIWSPTVYAKGSYEQVYGPSTQWLKDLVKPPLPAGERLAAPKRWVFFYPAMAPFDEKIETTFGSNSLILTPYFQYVEALAKNESLMTVLGVSRYFDSNSWTVRAHAPVLPRFHVPRQVRVVDGDESILRSLATEDLSSTALLTRRDVGDINVTQDPDARFTSIEATEARYELQMTASSDSLLRIAIPYYPGWQATVSGAPARILRVDHALMGIVVPKGAHWIRLQYTPTYLAWGAVVSLLSLAFVVKMGLSRRVNQRKPALEVGAA